MPQNNQSIKAKEIDEIVSQKMKSFLSLKDIPAGAPLARQLALNFGDLDLVEDTGESFTWGVTIWGTGRIGSGGNV